MCAQKEIGVHCSQKSDGNECVLSERRGPRLNEHLNEVAGYRCGDRVVEESPGSKGGMQAA